MRILPLAGLLMTLAPAPASALITNVDFRGFGRVTFVDVTDPLLRPPAVGTPVRITGSLSLGSAAVPDRFTGDVVFDEAALFANQQDFGWTVIGGRSGGSTDVFAYAGGSASFVAGRLTGINIYIDYDGEIVELGPTRWASTFSYSDDSNWGGSWTLSVPEPASWAMLVAGFGLAGIALRRGRKHGPHGSSRGTSRLHQRASRMQA